VHADLEVLDGTRNPERGGVEIEPPGLEREQECKLCVAFGFVFESKR